METSAVRVSACVFCAGFLAVVLVFAFVSTAWADERPSATLEYDRESGAEGCPEAAELKSTVAARLGYDPFAAAAPKKILVRVFQRAGELVGHFEMKEASGKSLGSREIASARRDCQEVITSLAVAIAIGIDPLSLTRAHPMDSPPPPPPPPPAPVIPPPPVRTVDASKPEPEKPKPQPVRLRAAAGAVAAFGAEPATDLGMVLQIGARWRDLSAGLEGRMDLPVSADAGGGKSVSASLLLVSVVPCAHYRVLLACALGGAGSLRGAGESVSDPQKDGKLYAAAGGRIAVEIPIAGPLALRAHADLLATFTRITLQLNGRDVWTTPPVSGALGAGLAVTF